MTFGAYKEKPFSIFRSVAFGIHGRNRWNHDGVSIHPYSGIWIDVRFKNYWECRLANAYSFESFSDDDVRRGGVLIKKPADLWTFIRISTDSRKKGSAAVKSSLVENPYQLLGR